LWKTAAQAVREPIQIYSNALVPADNRSQSLSSRRIERFTDRHELTIRAWHLVAGIAMSLSLFGRALGAEAPVPVDTTPKWRS
jgi:hypothetical protein